LFAWLGHCGEGFGDEADRQVGVIEGGAPEFGPVFNLAGDGPVLGGGIGFGQVVDVQVEGRVPGSMIVTREAATS
jgi:hypothetical protein